MVSIIEDKMKPLAELCRQYHVNRLEVFGSAAVDDMKETSDLDFLVEFAPVAGAHRFDNFFAFKDALEKLFDKSVDLIEPGGLHNPYFIRSVNQTRKVIYAAS